MIIRSGLIRNRDGVDFEAFTKHWREVHGPLVTKIDGLRAYSQNHVVARIEPVESGSLHRVDGVSQLYFDDIPAMQTAMTSPEQEACIVDLRGFLSDVTLLIQEMGMIETVGNPEPADQKLLFLLGGTDADLEEMVTALKAQLLAQGVAAQIRLNPIIARDIFVDKTIRAGEQVVDAVCEVWFGDEPTQELASQVVFGSNGIEVVDGFVVRELPIVRMS